MKKFLGCLMAVAGAMLIYGCQQKNPTACHIVGTVNGEQYEGKRIFLVPLFGPSTAEYVDSVEIKDGKFEFFPDSVKMYKILMDYHYRFGLQQLIVLGEPGEIKVVIDSISSASGTPQNDSLQMWKEHTEKHHMQYGFMNKGIAALKAKGDTIQTAALKQQADSLYLAYKNYTRQLAKNLNEGPLHDFLEGLYPLTYKRKMPDGRIVTMNADTHEEIKE